MLARLAICCTCGGLPLLAGIGALTESTASALVVRLGLESQAPFDVPKDGSFTVVLDLPNIDLSAMPDTRLVITAYSPARTRTAIAEAVRRELPRTVDNRASGTAPPLVRCRQACSPTPSVPASGRAIATSRPPTPSRYRDADRPGQPPAVTGSGHDARGCRRAESRS